MEEKSKEQKVKENVTKGKSSNGKPVETVYAKNEACVRGLNLPISTKHAIAICRFINTKKINQAISELGEVIKFKKAVPFRGEIPHRHGKGIVSGRYPIKAAKQFLKMLKNLIANAAVSGLNTDNLNIIAKADFASRNRSSRRYRKFKRTNVLIKVQELRVADKAKKKIGEGNKK